jgi:alkylation response protein AidB-like acyl-CoA dehydrogenase
MFDLDTTDETRAVTELGRSIGMDVLFPLAKQAEAAAEMPTAARNALFESGLTVAVASEFGGGGVLSCSTEVAAIEALSYGDAGLTLASAWSGAASTIVALLGSASQQAEVLPQLATNAATRATVALYEGYGRSPSEFATRLTPRLGVGFVLTGAKVAVSDPHHAERLLVVARDPDEDGFRIVMVKPDHAGVIISTPVASLALDAARLCSVSFDCEIDKNDVLSGQANMGQSDNATHLALSRVRLLVAAASLGCAQRAIDYAAKYANERIAFGKPISAFQGVSFLLAEAAIRLGAARVEVLEVADRIDHGDAHDIERRTTNAVNYTGAVAAQAARDAMQVLGGHGFIKDHPVEIWYRTTAALAALDFDPLCTAFEPAL